MQFKRAIKNLIIIALLNIMLIIDMFRLGTVVSIISVPALIVFFIIYNIFPVKSDLPQTRLRILAGGYELMLSAICCVTFEAFLYLYICLYSMAEYKTHILIMNAVVSCLLAVILLLNGIIRMFVCSSQIGILPRVLLLFCWWVPIINIILLKKFFGTSGREYEFASNKYKLNEDRKQKQICKTKYPLLMVHGIFFRDWKNYNYWGRIPKELINNGAVIFYGNQQSSASVEQSAEELKECIIKNIEETKCEKVNIIAHSKGGLDSRYAISCLGMGKYIASLTTINTPHHGCNYVGKILNAVPEKGLMKLGKKYESLYSKLGDENPDFFNGLSGLTDKECARLNDIMKDDENVLYQSVGSRMKSYSGAIFPLNIGYLMIKGFEGDNDGLVSTKSMEWGNFLGVLSPKGKQGISHGDVIDLTRKNIKGFDVCEFYVDLVSKLKQNGF